MTGRDLVAPANRDEALQIATDLRANGRSRVEVLAQLGAYGLDATIAEPMIDEVDLVAGILGRAHPADISAAIRERIDTEAMLLPPGNYPGARKRVDPHAAESPAEIMAKRSLSSARQMLADGKHVADIVAYLIGLGCPPDEAERLVASSAEELRVARELADQERQRRNRKRLTKAALVLLVVAVLIALVIFL